MALSGIQRTFADILDSIWGKDAQTNIPTRRFPASPTATPQRSSSLGKNTTLLAKVPVGTRCSICSPASCRN